MSGGPVSRLSFHWPAPKCNGSLITHYIIQQRLVHTKASKQHKGKLVTHPTTHRAPSKQTGGLTRYICVYVECMSIICVCV
jgi:hypothetical protein